MKSLQELVEALKRAHARLLVPPERIRDDPEKASKWVPSVRPSLNWESLLRQDSQAGAGRSTRIDRSAVLEEQRDDEEEKKGEPLTVGLIGQPNVGKSSLLNALLGEQKVRASKTPGKVCSPVWTNRNALTIDEALSNNVLGSEETDQDG